MAAAPTFKRVILLLSAPTIWMAHLLLSYSIVSLVCVLQLTDRRLLGMNLAEFGVALITAGALLAIAGIAMGSLRKWRRTDGPDTEMKHFFALNTLLLCALSALALIWVAFPTVILPSCAA